MERSEMTVLEEIAAERQRQIEVEGWTPNHDDEHDRGEMANAAACYALSAGRASRPCEVPLMTAPSPQALFAAGQ